MSIRIFWYEQKRFSRFLTIMFVFPVLRGGQEKKESWHRRSSQGRGAVTVELSLLGLFSESEAV